LKIGKFLPKLILSKIDFSELENVKIKYDYEGFDVRNNFSYRNLFKLKMDFELQNRETSRV
jgi:hypothetical protein